ncbi:hypothetical protein [Pantoea dispersa]|uniref:hypothetical protein n=1 Tax=Pantoea dispersa TaxID=59814 RepID=UPI001F519672|nr:hypothetical protein [Pantoea dispersa]MCI1027049.1 hypothetical protein [Pantoea dispersa]MDR6295857.1 hypothetical protein [Pantoea dispersa]
MSYNKDSSESTQVIYKVIKSITNDTNFASFIGVVTATVNDEVIIDHEKIQIHLTNSRPNYALIDIFWEDSGYGDYKSLGLFGRMSTQYQRVEENKKRTFTIYNDLYSIEVEY